MALSCLDLFLLLLYLHGGEVRGVTRLAKLLLLVILDGLLPSVFDFSIELYAFDSWSSQFSSYVDFLVEAGLLARSLVSLSSGSSSSSPVASSAEASVPPLTPEMEFRCKYPEARVASSFFSVVGILPPISLAAEKQAIREAALDHL